MKIIVTGSSRLDTYRRVGDSLMGRYFQEQLGVPFAFQVVLQMDYADVNCFRERRTPWVVPAKTFLSQLI